MVVEAQCGLLKFRTIHKTVLSSGGYMSKEIHFVVGESYHFGKVLHTWAETKRALRLGLDTIVT